MKESIDASFVTEKALYLAYMPFIKNGGLFVRTQNAHMLGSLVSLSIRFPGESETYETKGKVVWITPKSAQGNKLAGIGVQLMGEQSRVICNKIETCLAGMLKSTLPTDTI